MLRHWTATVGAVALAVAVSFAPSAHAHTWIDCIDTDRKVVYDNARAWIYGGAAGNGICEGYMKNYPGRGDANINREMTFKILMDDVTKGAPVCTSEPAVYNNPEWRHRITVKPGETFYYGYLDNGHTSKDKAGRGTFYGTYWTGEPETELKTTTELTETKLVDGKLHDFDDGNCGQSFEDGDFSGSVLSGRAGNDFPCVGELKMPEGTKPGIYNLVWFWRFYNDKVNSAIETTGGHFGGAAYSSCFQVEVTGDGGETGNEGYSTPSPSSEASPTPSSTDESDTTNDASTAPPSDTPTPEPSSSQSSPLPPSAAPNATETQPMMPSPSPTLYETPTQTPSPTTEEPEKHGDENTAIQNSGKEGCRVKSPSPAPQYL